MSPIARWALKQYLAYMFFIGAFILGLTWLYAMIMKWKIKQGIIQNTFQNLMLSIDVLWHIWICLVICNLSGISIVCIIAVIVRDFILHEKILQNYLYYTDPNGAVRHWSKMGLNFFQFKRRYRWNHWTGNPHRIL